ncbi:class I SAM-dependent methyltransferase [Chlorobium sp. N1]|uniref:class I SAM-dependent methyltransferase n=1 Tax=Chlorobium sp. N1 TaxID=2491138 RepID=UPI00103DA296|nr:class I SAM-dependent methyltransferase [Chlorobium sp. N1]TCD48442.1 class I SAM-dependent methyltransferase [Chlorobium sp. N1]
MTHQWHSSDKFNRQAEGWDENPRRLGIAESVFRALSETVHFKAWHEVLEFGCGTGLVTMQVAPLVRKLTAIDTSHRMLGVLEGKIMATETKNIESRCLDLTDPGEMHLLPKGHFNVVYASMTLHHIDDTAAFLKEIAGLLAPGGTLAIADLDHEDGYFHDDAEEKVHPGFERRALATMLEAAGLKNPAFRTAMTVEKKNRAGRQASYPIFLATATKPAA